MTVPVRYQLYIDCINYILIVSISTILIIMLITCFNNYPCVDDADCFEGASGTSSTSSSLPVYQAFMDIALQETKWFKKGSYPRQMTHTSIILCCALISLRFCFSSCWPTVCCSNCYIRFRR